MTGGKIQQVWLNSHEAFDASGRFQSEVQRRASRAILYCKSGKLGANLDTSTADFLFPACCEPAGSVVADFLALSCLDCAYDQLSVTQEHIVTAVGIILPFIVAPFPYAGIIVP